MMAKIGTSKDLYAQNNNNPYVKRQGNNNNPYVKRRGNGRSTMGDKVDAEKDNNGVDDGDIEDEGDEDFGDNSIIKYNNNLRNSSGYNEDL